MDSFIVVDPERLGDLARAFSHARNRVEEALTAFSTGARDAGEAIGRAELAADYEGACRGTIHALGQLSASLGLMARRIDHQAALSLAAERSALGAL